MTATTHPTAHSPGIDGESVLAPLLLPSDDWTVAGRGDALNRADERRRRSARSLQDLFDQAPSWRASLRAALRRVLQTDPEACGLEDGDRQIKLLDFAACLLVNPATVNPFVTWSTWGVEKASGYAALTGRQWVQALTPALAGRCLVTRYWDTRMPGQSISRRAHGQHQLREHFHASLELNYGLGHVPAKGWEVGQLDHASRYAQLLWHQPGTPMKLCPDALLIRPGSSDTPWLMYRPQARNPVRAFQNEATLVQWAHEHRHLLWHDTPTPLKGDSTSIRVTALAGDGFSGLLRSILASAEQLFDDQEPPVTQPPLDWSKLETQEAQRKPHFNQTLPEALGQRLKLLVSTDEALAAQELHFDSLDERLPLGWRKQRIDRQERLLSLYLGNDTEPTSSPMTNLRAQQAKLDKQDAALQTLLTTLPETLTSDTWGQAHGDRSRFEHLSQHFASALLLEAEFQHLLGELGASRLQWVRELVDRPESSFQRPVVPRALKLVTGDRSWMLTGLMTLQALPGNDEQAADTALLLYKPGYDGGLAAFDSEEQLFERLLNTLHGAWPETLLESAWPQDTGTLIERLDSAGAMATLVSVPITSHAFDYLTQTHLALLTQADNASRQQWRWKLGATHNGARQQAFERLAERNRTTNLHTQLHPKLAHLDAAQRTVLAGQVDALRSAMLASSQLLARDLPERGQFARNQLNAYLRSTFSLSEVPIITLNIANHTGRKREAQPESGFANAYRMVTTFSAERSNIRLEDFLLWALDDDLTLRLGNADIVIDDPESFPDLKQKITHSSIANLVKTLDLAGAYEQKILSAFQGGAGQSDWEAQWRQETLQAPFEHQLKILALSQPSTLDTAGRQVLELYCQEQLDRSRLRTVRHHSLVLRPGTAPDGSSSRETLSGIFLLEPTQGPVLLLMPDAPNGRTISQYSSLQAACQALESMAVDTAMRNYLASRPYDGKSSAHLAYLDQALLAGFSGFIGVGSTRTATFAEIQANLLMGRLISEHRASSRSQVDLFLEKEAIRHGRVYDYIKLAIGVIPGIGALVALYDGWHAASASVEAFLRGAPDEGIEHLNSVFLSLVDAIFDVLSFAQLTTTSPQAHARTHNRQRLAGLRPTSVTRQGRPNPFDGYATEAPAGRWSNHPEAYGRGVHRHVQSGNDFILHQGAYYQVEWDATYLTWRLKGSASRSYKQPIRLGELGNWTSHGGVSGRLVDNGLAGGGAMLGRLYRQGWENLRGYLGRQPIQRSPRQVVQDIVNRRVAEVNQLNAKLKAFQDSLGNADPAVTQRALRKSADQLESFVKFSLDSLEELRGIKPQLGRHYQGMHDQLATALGRQHPALVQQRHLQMQAHFRHVRQLEEMSPNTVDEILGIHRQLKLAHEALGQTLSRMELELHRVAKVTTKLRGDSLTQYQRLLDSFDIPLDPNGYRTLRLSIQASGFILLPASYSDDFLLLLREVRREITALRDQLFSHNDLPAADLSRAQRYRFLQQVKARYQRFNNYMTAWQDSFPSLVTAQSTQSLRKELDKLIAEVDTALCASAPIKRTPAIKRGASRPRAFDTVDQRQLIGHEVRVDGQVQMQVGSRLDQAGNNTFTRAGDNRWQSTITQPAETLIGLPSLMATGRRRLRETAAQHAKLRQYKALNMTPASLQDLADGYAATLDDLAQAITRKAGEPLEDAQIAMVRGLKQAAEELQALGKQLRIEQAKASRQPGFSHLEYLHAQEQVNIQWSRTLEPATNKQGKAIE
ncbi:hypothetical protein JET64_23470 [Pseudomonas putida]|nr:hypothetical protein [Pseudomonas putida]